MLNYTDCEYDEGILKPEGDEVGPSVDLQSKSTDETVTEPTPYRYCLLYTSPSPRD